MKNTLNLTSINVGGQNLYAISLLKAFKEFFEEEVSGNMNSELRLTKKIEAARTLFPEHRRELRNVAVA